MAKLRVSPPADDDCRAKLILVTSMSATPKGAGKTVTSIGLGQAFGKLGLRGCVCLRQPSLGPTLGMKGGAAGGGLSHLLPANEINLHFTGDLHAITSAHNLMAALVDNHVHFDNAKQIEVGRSSWPRVLDLCDRQLRGCLIGRGSPSDGFEHETRFEITAASEVMAVLSLATDLGDLRKRLNRMVVARDRSGTPIAAKEVDATGAMLALLKDALHPNLVQTREHTPALVHCGPFANIAHGCSSVIATRLAMSLADYVFTEAGFSTELGAEKFFHIKCPQAGVWPAVVVLVVGCSALRWHGGAAADTPNEAALRLGLANLDAHVENLRCFGVPVVVALNKSASDTPSEIEMIRMHCEQLGAEFAPSDAFTRGGEGTLDLAERVRAVADATTPAPRALYRADAPLLDKLRVLAKTLYRADDVTLGDAALDDLAWLEQHGLAGLPLCVAKTQHSLSDDKHRRGVPRNWNLRVRSLSVSAGAGFIVAHCGNVTTMPGMPKHPRAERIDVDDTGEPVGLE
jgi:formate--tetrahydrofolate ligase